MKIIAIEEAFSMEGLPMVPAISGTSIPISPQYLKEVEERCPDFEKFAYPTWTPMASPCRCSR